MLFVFFSLILKSIIVFKVLTNQITVFNDNQSDTRSHIFLVRDWLNRHRGVENIRMYFS